jgi:hypothetical protein
MGSRDKETPPIMMTIKETITVRTGRWMENREMLMIYDLPGIIIKEPSSSR